MGKFLSYQVTSKSYHASIYSFKVNKRDTKAMPEIFSKLDEIHNVVLVSWFVNLEQTSLIAMVFPLMTLIK